MWRGIVAIGVAMTAFLSSRVRAQRSGPELQITLERNTEAERATAEQLHEVLRKKVREIARANGFILEGKGDGSPRVGSRPEAIPVPDYWGEVKPGPYRVGFTQRWIIDSTRRLPRPDKYRLRYRPVLLNVWYPAATASARQPFVYDDYFEGAVRAARGNGALVPYAQAIVDYQRSIAWHELAGTPRDSTPSDLTGRIEQLFRSPTHAVRDAPRRSGVLPVVVYTQGARGSMDDNVVLCEFLSSRGYLVIGSAFPEEDNATFHTNSTDESRQRDIRRLLLEVQRTFGMTAQSVAVIGHSAGAQAMHLLASDPSAPVDAVLSLDTTQDYSMLSDRTWQFPQRTLAGREYVTMPFLYVAGPGALFELADSLHHSARTLLTVPGLGHNEFISQGVIRGHLAAGLARDNAARRDTVQRHYRMLVDYMASWIDATREVRAALPPPPAPLRVTQVPVGENAPTLGAGTITTARELRHLFTTGDASTFAERSLAARKTDGETFPHSAFMMLLADAARTGKGDRARTLYSELIARDAGMRNILTAIESRARLFERIGAQPEATEWRNIAATLGGSR